jgi:hypothetical protein
MRKALLTASALVAFATAAVPCYAQPADEDGPGSRHRKPVQIKTRLDHFSGTQWVLVLSYLPSEITSITCQTWTMLGINSWKHHNDFTIPAGPSVAVLDADKFQGYCKEPGSIVAHTDDGDYVGVLDRGDGNWNASTKLTFIYNPKPE